MSLKKVMVDGGTVGFAAGSQVSGGTFTITATPSTVTKVDGHGAFCGPLSWTFSGGNASGAANGSVMGAGSINPTAQFIKDEGKAFVLEGDSVTVTFNGVTTDGYPIAFPGVTVKVLSAGQSVVLGD